MTNPRFDVPVWVTVKAVNQEEAWNFVEALVEHIMEGAEAEGEIVTWKTGEPIKEPVRLAKNAIGL